MMTEEEQLKIIRYRIFKDSTNTSEDEFLKILLNQAKFRYLRLVYPFDRTIKDLPDERAQEWQVRCAIELYNIEENGHENVIQYSEIGTSETFARAGISADLLAELPPPRAGVIK